MQSFLAFSYHNPVFTRRLERLEVGAIALNDVWVFWGIAYAMACKVGDERVLQYH